MLVTAETALANDQAGSEIAERVWHCMLAKESRWCVHYIKANRTSTSIGFGQFQRQQESRSMSGKIEYPGTETELLNSNAAAQGRGVRHDPLLGEPR